MKRLAALFAPLLLAGAARADLDAETIAKLDQAFAPWNKPNQPGGVAGVVKDGKLVYAKGFGLASMEFSAPLTPDSVIDIGSVSKHFTSTAILVLEDQGKVKLSDDIRAYIPELPAYKDTVTVGNLLHHTSGLRDYFTLFALKGWQMDSPLENSDVIAMLKRQRGVDFAPGKGWTYSNTNFVLASIIVERVSGQKFAEFARNNIFRKLDMASTTYDSDLSKMIPWRVPSYRQTGTVWNRILPVDTPVGDGAVLTTINDFAKWDLALRTNKLGLKAPGHLARLSAPAIVPGSPMKYGLGLMIDEFQGLKRIQHGGDWLGFNAQYSMLPDKGISVFSFGNDGTQLGKSLNTEALKALLGSEAPRAGAAAEKPWTPEAFNAISGSWAIKLPNGPLNMRIFTQNGGRVLQADGQPAIPIFLGGEDQFFAKAAPIKVFRVKADDKGVWTEARLEQEVGGQTIKIPMNRAEPFKPTAEQVKAWEGAYFSPELDVVYTLKASGTGLTLAIAQREPGPVSANSADVLALGPMRLKGVIKDGRVSGFTLDAGRANGLVFERLRP